MTAMNNELTSKGVLIICEYTDKGVHKVAYELLNKGGELAKTLNQPLECLLIAPKGADVASLTQRGADNIFVIEGDCFRKPEEILFKENAVRFITEHNPLIVLIGATEFGRSLAPRIACALGTGLTADCTDLIINEDGEFIQVRPAFSDNILAHIKTINIPKICTVRYKEFSEAACTEGEKTVVIRKEPYVYKVDGCEITNMSELSDKNISEAEIIVAAGRGIKNSEGMKVIEALAYEIGGTVGVSRALVDAGIASSERQVGYSGHRVKPKIYIACGISGAPQHMAGMKESDVVIAINKDPSAPIFNIADYGFVGDLFEIVPYLTEKLRKEK